jgi:hypothetical protein
MILFSPSEANGHLISPRILRWHNETDDTSCTIDRLSITRVVKNIKTKAVNRQQKLFRFSQWYQYVLNLLFSRDVELPISLIASQDWVIAQTWCERIKMQHYAWHIGTIKKSIYFFALGFSNGIYDIKHRTSLAVSKISAKKREREKA